MPEELLTIELDGGWIVEFDKSALEDLLDIGKLRLINEGQPQIRILPGSVWTSAQVRDLLGAIR